MTSENGSVLPLFGGLVFVAFVVIALVVDIALLGVAYRTAASHADIVAEAGAAMVDHQSIHVGEILLDVPAAASQTMSAAVSLGLPSDAVSVDADVSGVCATVSVPHRTFALAFIGAQSVDVVVRSCASPAVG